MMIIVFAHAEIIRSRIVLCVLLLFLCKTSVAQKQPTLQKIHDSATILFPAHGTVLTDSQTVITITPHCTINACMIFVTSYYNKIDTLGYFTTPPYSIEWNYSSLKDQDQIHFQIGYALFHTSGDTIRSSPTPHHWIINRFPFVSNKKMKIISLQHKDTAFQTNGVMRWNIPHKKMFPHGTFFTTRWTSTQFFLFAKIYDSTPSVLDHIEVCFDLPRKKTLFLTLDQRILSFYPRGGTYFWSIDFTDTSSTIVDSINYLLKSEIKYQSKSFDSGYTISAIIPFYLLSSLSFPQVKAGFDFSVIDYTGDHSSETPNVFSWSGVSASKRHSPSTWGTIQFTQPYKFFKNFLQFIFYTAWVSIAFIIVITLYIFLSNILIHIPQNISAKKQQLMDHLEDAVAEVLHKKDISLHMISQACGTEEHTVNALIHAKGYPDFNAWLLQKRIVYVKKLLKDTELCMSDIIKLSGFINEHECNAIFCNYTGVSAEEWRKNNKEKHCIDSED